MINANGMHAVIDSASAIDVPVESGPVQPLAVPPRVAARLLSCSERTLYSLERQEKICRVAGMGRKVLYSVKSLQAFVESGSVSNGQHHE